MPEATTQTIDETSNAPIPDSSGVIANYNAGNPVIPIVMPDNDLFLRILQAYEMDRNGVSKHNLDLSSWALQCVMDWVEVVELEVRRKERETHNEL